MKVSLGNKENFGKLAELGPFTKTDTPSEK